MADAFRTGASDPRIVETLIVLIPKVDVPTKFKEFRPVSLCTMIYKVLTKVLVGRIRPLLNNLISSLQGSYIPGRSSADNILVAQEALHFMKKTKHKWGFLAMKIDLEKAYHNVNWDFLRLI